MTTRLRYTLSILAFAAVSAFSQTTGFTGSWKRLDGSGTVTVTITQQDSRLTMAFASRFNAGHLSGSLADTQTYTVDGSERVDKTPGGRETWTTAWWQGASVVIQRVTKSGYRVSITRDVWSLSPDKAELTRARRTIDMDGVSESTEVYRRQ
ncbi:MAG: hypothetical protein HY820_32710 [Acidobacteria bacterium]|nr:hypothetical protein [Acidobacteriota bacterium]